MAAFVSVLYTIGYFSLYNILHHRNGILLQLLQFSRNWNYITINYIYKCSKSLKYADDNQAFYLVFAWFISAVILHVEPYTNGSVSTLVKWYKKVRLPRTRVNLNTTHITYTSMCLLNDTITKHTRQISS